MNFDEVEDGANEEHAWFFIITKVGAPAGKLNLKTQKPEAWKLKWNSKITHLILYIFIGHYHLLDIIIYWTILFIGHYNYWTILLLDEQRGKVCTSLDGCDNKLA